AQRRGAPHRRSRARPPWASAPRSPAGRGRDRWIAVFLTVEGPEARALCTMHTPLLDISSSTRTDLPARARRPRRVIGPVLAAPLACGTAVGATLGSAPAFAQTAPKFAVIDMRRAISETEEGLRVQANLKRLLDSRQSELETKTRQLQTEKEALEK